MGPKSTFTPEHVKLYTSEARCLPLCGITMELGRPRRLTAQTQTICPIMSQPYPKFFDRLPAVSFYMEGGSQCLISAFQTAI